MKNPSPPTDRSSLIRWEFERGNRHLACAVSVADDAPGFEVATLPLWSGGCHAVERFDSPREALHRHAAIVAGLRDEGWMLSAYTG